MKTSSTLATLKRCVGFLVLLVVVTSCISGDDDDPTATAIESRSTPTSVGETATPTVPPSTPASTETTTDGIGGASGLGDPYYPGAGNGGYDVLHYDLELRYEPDTDLLHGNVAIDAVVTEAIDWLYLDFSGFDITEIHVDGVATEFSRNGSELRVDLPDRVEAGQSIEISVVYVGIPEATAGPFQEAVGWKTTDDGAYVLSEPTGAPTWYPVNDHPLDKASYSFHITVPSGLEVLANGTHIETLDAGDGWMTWVYDSPSEMASYLAMVAIGQFEFEEMRTDDGLVIRNAYDAAFADDAAQNFERTPDMVAFFEDLFGPYPFEIYGSAVLDFNWGGIALETQTFSIFDSNYARRGISAEPAVAHELAHQWFGDSISLESWDDIWLNEGFATYAHWLWIEEASGVSVDRYIASNVIPNVSNVTLPPPGAPGRDDMFAGSVYVRGALTLHALRQTVGDDTFFEILRTYVETYTGLNVSTDDFIEVAESVSGQQLDQLFESWLFSQELPDLPGA